jgi:hypothetical protein
MYLLLEDKLTDNVHGQCLVFRYYSTIITHTLELDVMGKPSGKTLLLLNLTINTKLNANRPESKISYYICITFVRAQYTKTVKNIELVVDA